MKRTYRCDSIKVWWNNYSTAYPKDHIENIYGVEWTEIDNKIEWIDNNTISFICYDNDCPNYLKITDGLNNFYFLISNAERTIALKDEKFMFQYTFELDKYMSYYQMFLSRLIIANPTVNFVHRFFDRFIFTVDENNVLQSIRLNVYQQPWLLKYEPKELMKIRSYLYGTNPEKLMTLNYPKVNPPTAVTFDLWNNAEITTTIPYADFITPNNHGRFEYIVASSSALITGQGNYSTHGNQNKIIIPVFQSIRSNIYKALNQMDPSVSINAGINALGGANMGVFEADTPFALFYGLSKNDENVKLLFAQNTTYDKEVINVVFFMIPSSFAPKWEIINYADYLNGFDGRIKTMINNFVYRLDWETEPYLLNPNFYLEQYKMGDTDLNIDLSLIDYYVPNFSEIDTKGFSLYGYHVFNNNLEIIYDFNDYNNDENPIWNNNYSNIQQSSSLNAEAYASSTANFYTNNVNTQATSLKLIKIQAGQDLMNNAFNLASGLARSISANTLTMGTRLMSTGIKAIGGIYNSLTDNMKRNIQYQSEVNNIRSGADTIINNPYASTATPNISVNSNTLYHTYALTLNEWEQNNILTKILNESYICDCELPIAEYINRKEMNVLHINTYYNYDILLEILNNFKYGFFEQLIYYVDFLNWLNGIHRIYTNNFLINTTDPNRGDYIPNIELDIPNYPTMKTNIADLIVNRKLAKMVNRVMSKEGLLFFLKKINPLIPDDLVDSIDIIGNDGYYQINVKPNDPNYYGNVIVNFPIQNVYCRYTYANEWTDIIDIPTLTVPKISTGTDTQDFYISSNLIIQSITNPENAQLLKTFNIYQTNDIGEISFNNLADGFIFNANKFKVYHFSLLSTSTKKTTMPNDWFLIENPKEQIINIQHVWINKGYKIDYQNPIPININLLDTNVQSITLIRTEHLLSLILNDCSILTDIKINGTNKTAIANISLNNLPLMNISSIDSISFAIANNNDKHQFIHNWYMVGLPLIPTIDIQPDYIQNNERMVIDIDSNQSLTKAILKIDHFGQSLPTECNLNFSNCPNINEVHLKAFVYAVASNLNVNIANGTYPSSGTIYRHNTTGFHDKIVIHNVPSGWVVKDE